ncbi:597_t:CDS:2, partial [Funneliformis geosporum]
RFDAASVFKDDVLYVLGGANNGKSIPEILSIDLTTSFTIDSPPWSQSLKAPPLAFVSSGVVLGGYNNNFILVVGGYIQDPFSQSIINNEETLIVYDIQHNDWRRVAMATAPELNQRVKFKILSDNNGNAYLHGAPQTPIIADDYSSVLLKDGRMIIIGGFGAPVDKVFVHTISQIEIFDTNDNIWSRQIVPQPNEMTDHQTYTKPFQWRIPVISGLEPPLLNEHCAELVENRYIFIMFDMYVTRRRIDNIVSNELYILDTENYSWIKSFKPKLSISIFYKKHKNRSGTVSTQAENAISRTNNSNGENANIMIYPNYM